MKEHKDTNFIPPKEVWELADFANKVTFMVYKNCGQNLDRTIEEIVRVGLYRDFTECTRSVQTLIRTQIPIFCYYELKKNGREYYCRHYGYTEERYNSHISDSIKSVRWYYVHYESLFNIA